MKARQSALCVCLLLIVSALAGSLGAIAEGAGPEEVRTTPIIVFEGYDVDILDAYAVTETVRILENPNDEPMDHTFEFSIPEGALISNFSIEVEDEVYYAEVLEKELAQERYNESVQAGNTAGLVASSDDENFEYSVSFAPGERITATLRYEQMLLKTRGWHEYVLPFDASSYVDEVGDLMINLDVEAPEEIQEFLHEGYTTLITDENVVSNNAYLEVRAEDIIPDCDLVVRWRTGGGSPAGVMYFGEWNGEGYFLHVYDPDPSGLGEEQLGKDFVFVVDRSGSMDGTKFEQSKEALEHIYSGLITEDRFSLVEFNTRAIAYSDTLIPVDETSVTNVLNYIRSLQSGGGTDIHEGLMVGLDIFKADDGSVPVLVLLTDGKANSGLYHQTDFRQDVLEKNTVNAPIFSIALGYGADWDFVEPLSLENDGKAIWVQEDEDVVSAIADFVDTFSTPLVSNLVFEYGPDVYDVHPSEVRAHYDGSEVLVAGRFSDITELPMMLSATTGSGDIVTEQVFPVDARPAHDFVPRFWAFSRMKDLEDHMKYNGTDDATVQEITDLAIDFHFVTDYTSLFVELPEDIQERFDNGGYPLAEGSNPDLKYDEGQKNDAPGTLGYQPGTPQGAGSSQTGSVNDPAPPPSNTDTSNDNYAHSVVIVTDGSSGAIPAGMDMDGDGMTSKGLPDIEENYESSRGADDTVSLAAPQRDSPGLSSGALASEDATQAIVVPWAALSIVLIPLATVLVVALHWFTVGRHRHERGHQWHRIP